MVYIKRKYNNYKITQRWSSHNIYYERTNTVKCPTHLFLLQNNTHFATHYVLCLFYFYNKRWRNHIIVLYKFCVLTNCFILKTFTLMSKITEVLYIIILKHIYNWSKLIFKLLFFCKLLKINKTNFWKLYSFWFGFCCCYQLPFTLFSTITWLYSLKQL